MLDGMCRPTQKGRAEMPSDLDPLSRFQVRLQAIGEDADGGADGRRPCGGIPNATKAGEVEIAKMRDLGLDVIFRGHAGQAARREDFLATVESGETIL
jgi:hypothetical protein